MAAGSRRLLFLGAPGVGKGTYASRLSKKWGLPHIATGDIIRAEIKSGSPLGAKFRDYNDRGALVPDDMVVELARKRLSQSDAQSGFILDGFPRTLPQAVALRKADVGLDMCLSLTLRKDLLISKLSGRRVCEDCGTVYNICDIEEGEYRFPALLPKEETRKDCPGRCERLAIRGDDSQHIVEKRLETYGIETEPLIEFYTKMNILMGFDVKKGVEDLPAVEKLILSYLEERQASKGG